MAVESLLTGTSGCVFPSGLTGSPKLGTVAKNKTKTFDSATPRHRSLIHNLNILTRNSVPSPRQLLMAQCREFKGYTHCITIHPYWPASAFYLIELRELELGAAPSRVCIPDCQKSTWPNI